MKLPVAQAELALSRSHSHTLPGKVDTSQKVLVVGTDGTVGRAIMAGLQPTTDVDAVELETIRLDVDLEHQCDWSRYDTIINAATYDAPDKAETPEGRRDAWAMNVDAVARLAEVARDHDLPFVQFSSDDIFDGTKPGAYTETDPMCPVSTFGQTRAAGEFAAMAAPKHYILRSAWIVGEGPTFLHTMRVFANDGTDPRVINDQRGRLTFVEDLRNAVQYLVENEAPYGIYNVTSTGVPLTWEDIAKEVFMQLGQDPARVRGVPRSEFYRNSAWNIAPRPANAVLDTRKIERTGFVPGDMLTRIREYLHR